jgi:hypothetical protein
MVAVSEMPSKVAKPATSKPVKLACTAWYATLHKSKKKTCIFSIC